MGVFGEKHTSLTREQKRQLIHQADTHKLRPTEVCDWVQATWGLRIARVTVYSILHKQRASLMAGHKDLYQTVQNSLTGLTGSSSTSTDAAGQISTNTHASAEDCLDRNKETGRVNKYRASPNKNKNKNKDATTTANGSESNSTTSATATTTKASSRKATESSQSKKATATSSSSNNINTTTNNNKTSSSSSNGKRDRSSSVASDRSFSSTSAAQDALGEGMSLFTNCFCLLLCVQWVVDVLEGSGVEKEGRDGQVMTTMLIKHQKRVGSTKEKKRRTQTESDAMRCDASEEGFELVLCTRAILHSTPCGDQLFVCLCTCEKLPRDWIQPSCRDHMKKVRRVPALSRMTNKPFLFRISFLSPLLFPLYGFLLFVPALLRPTEQQSWVGEMEHCISVPSRSPPPRPLTRLASAHYRYPDLIPIQSYINSFLFPSLPY